MDAPILSFELLEDISLYDIDNSLSMNKRLLSLSNDYEEGKWRLSYFLQFILNNIGKTALSEKERQKCIGDPFSALKRSISRLRMSDKDNKGKGGEIAEILLYGIMGEYFNALPVVPKIFYKQNDNDNAKGADSVHITIENENSFNLWLGEAKFYNSIESSRLVDPIESVLNSLDKHAIRKETSVITNLKEIDEFVKDSELKKEILMALSPDANIDKIRKILHIPILLLHECGLTASGSELSPEFKQSLISKHRDTAIDFFSKLTAKNNRRDSPIFKLDEIKFHLILFPVPNKEEILNKLYTYFNQTLSI